VGFLNILLKATKEMRLPIFKKNIVCGDLGLGFDLGFTYYPSKNKLTTSLVDVGFVT
jgi:hypothetical protein